MPPTPSVQVTKVDGQTGVVPPSPVGVAAIISPAPAAAAIVPAGPVNQANGYADAGVVLSTYGQGPLVEDANYLLNVAGSPVVAVNPTTTTAAVYGAITKTGTGTWAATAGAGVPNDDYQVIVQFLTAGVLGVAGITYQVSEDGGLLFGGVQSLGTALAITLPGGESFTLGIATETVVVGDFFVCNVSHPRMTTGDLTTALEALRVTQSPWEGVLIDFEASSAEISLVDTWLQGLEATGKFRFAVLGTRHKNLPVPATETEAAFLTAMGTLVGGMSRSTRIMLGTDAGELTSTITGLTLPRSPALALMARLMLIPIGEDPAYVARGPIPGFTIGNGSGNPAWHDEMLYPGLDALGLTTFRTLGDGSGAVYITNGNVFSASGSDYVYAPHVRTMSRCCEIAFAVLRTQLSRGVGKKPPDPVTGQIYILEADAQAIEALVNQAVQAQVAGQVAGFQFVLARTDDLSSNQGATVHGQIQNEALAYIKKFAITAGFVKSLTTPSRGG